VGVAAQFRILGPLERWAAAAGRWLRGQAASPTGGAGARRPGSVGGPARRGTLSQDLPDTARSLLQVYVANLRKRLLGDADPAEWRGPCVCVA
jgi:hypothetical protein